MRLNYQQRDGRAGRRGQAFAIVLTLCRGRSHDEFYYQHPEKITGDPPPAPFLSIELFARHELFQQIENCANNLELAGEGLAERLAEGGILPMYGMPSRVRDL